MKIILEEFQVLLAPDEEQQKVFPNVTIAGFHIVKRLIDSVVRDSVFIFNNIFGSEPCWKRNY